MPWMALSPVVAADFSWLRISVSIHASRTWRGLHLVESVIGCEMAHDAYRSRMLHNERGLAKARRERTPVLREHGGFYDLFVPFGDKADGDAVLVTGPFAIARPTSTEVRDRWHKMTGTRAHLADPAFTRYLEATLATVVFEGSQLERFQQMMASFARLLAGDGSPPLLAEQVATLRAGLEEATSVERMWDAARGLVDERWTHVGDIPMHIEPLANFGMPRPPAHVLVGLVAARREENDPVDDVLRGDEFQRACVAMGRRIGGIMCGRVGTHGVSLLVASRDRGSRAKTTLLSLASRLGALAHRFGYRLHVGIARTGGSDSLALRYLEALGAAEKALSFGLRLVEGEPRPERAAEHLRKLRARLAESGTERPGLLLARFDHYLEATLVHTGYHLETVRVHLDAGLERLLEPLLKAGLLDERSGSNIWTSAERAVDTAGTVAELVAQYRRLVSDVENALTAPLPARRDRGTNRALAFIRDHLGERMTLPQVARVAGFAPGYFSKLLKRREGATFEQYVQRLRIARVQKTLADPRLTTERAAQLCGFPNRAYFHRVFERTVGMTPGAYRESVSKRTFKETKKGR